VYSSWRQVSGYFDGDGNLGVEVVRYVLRMKIRFTDTWRPQVEAVRGFLLRRKLSVGEIGVETTEGRNDAYRVEIAKASDVLRAARAMLPYCAKKAEDLQIAVDYLENRVTGDQAVARLNNEVLSLRRAGIVRQVNLPLTRSQGIRTKELENARKARLAHAINVGEETQNQIRKDHVGGLGIIRLSKKYGYSQSVVRRILGRL
jgi:hypothetical protein